MLRWIHDQLIRVERDWYLGWDPSGDLGWDPSDPVGGDSGRLPSGGQRPGRSTT